MKRVKIMLTAIGILAVVGGAVAFNAAKFGAGAYCTGPAGSGCCPTKTLNISFQNGLQIDYRKIPASAVCTGTNCICTSTGNIIN